MHELALGSGYLRVWNRNRDPTADSRRRIRHGANQRRVRQARLKEAQRPASHDGDHNGPTPNEGPQRRHDFGRDLRLDRNDGRRNFAVQALGRVEAQAPVGE
jgi:hypothetical protein